MKGTRRQRGQETLQAVLAVSFMLLPVLLGMLELGGLLHIWMGQQAAAAIGARVAGERGEDDQIVRQQIRLELLAGGLDPSRVEVTVSPSYVHWSQPISVQLKSQRRITIPFLFSRDISLTSAYVARGEVNH